MQDELIEKLQAAIARKGVAVLSPQECRAVLAWKEKLSRAGKAGRRLRGEEPAASTLRSRKSRAKKKRI